MTCSADEDGHVTVVVVAQGHAFSIGPDGSAYVGTLGGLVKLRDGKK